jgi:hypothetical protein
MPHSHAIVWMDSKEAHVFKFNADDAHKQRIKVIGGGDVHLDHHYFDEIAKALDGVQEWLLTGSSTDELRSYLKNKLPELDKKLRGVESADHPTDGQLVDHARRFFKAADRLQPNSPAPPRG